VQQQDPGGGRQELVDSTLHPAQFDPSHTTLDPIPVTILAGFLGAGKTTMLNRNLSAKHGCKTGLLMNDFG
jgi:hypothetical protein